MGRAAAVRIAPRVVATHGGPHADHARKEAVLSLGVPRHPHDVLRLSTFNPSQQNLVVPFQSAASRALVNS